MSFIALVDKKLLSFIAKLSLFLRQTLWNENPDQILLSIIVLAGSGIYFDLVCDVQVWRIF